MSAPWPERVPGPAPLHVGYILKKFPRLSETFVLDELLGVEASGVVVSVFSLRLPDEGRFHADLAGLRASVRYLPALGSGSFVDALRGLERLDAPDLSRILAFADRLPPERRASVLLQGIHLADAARMDRIDHLHAHFVTVAAHTAYLAHLLTGIPFSVTAHAKDVYRDTVDPGLFAEIAGAATAVVTVCEANRRHIIERLAGGGARVEVVRNGLDLERFAPPRGPRDPRLVLAVGRLVEKKGFDVLIRAVGELVDRGTDLSCVIVGDGDRREDLERLRDSLGLGSRVRMAGPLPRDRVVGLMRRARVLAAPCLEGSDGNRDALPTVLLEALALGLPSVSTPIGGIPEIVDHGVEGLLVPPGDPTALAGALERLLVDDAGWAAMAEAGPRKAEARFDRRSNLPHLLEVFAGGPPVPHAGLVGTAAR